MKSGHGQRKVNNHGGIASGEKNSNAFRAV